MSESLQVVNDFREDVQALAEGNQEAYIRLYKRLGPKLYAFAYKLMYDPDEAEDVVQEIFIKVWEKKHLLNPELNFDNYLFTIARNLVYNKAKRRAYEFAYQHYLTGQPLTENNTENELSYRELNEIIQDFCQDLPPVRQRVFTLSRLEGYSNTEIARQLNTSNSNIENHLNKAIRLIKKKFKLYKIVYIFLTWLFS